MLNSKISSNKQSNVANNNANIAITSNATTNQQNIQQPQQQQQNNQNQVPQQQQQQQPQSQIAQQRKNYHAVNKQATLKPKSISESPGGWKFNNNNAFNINGVGGKQQVIVKGGNVELIKIEEMSPQILKQHASVSPPTNAGQSKIIFKQMPSQSISQVKPLGVQLKSSAQQQNMFSNGKIFQQQPIQQLSFSQQNNLFGPLITRQVKIERKSDNKKQGHVVQNVNYAIDNQYKFYIGMGNNGDLMRRIMATRDYWVETKDSQTMFVHFKWQQSNRGYKYDRLVDNTQYRQLVNHFEFHKEITNKNNLVKNLMYFTESNKMNIYDITPLTYILDLTKDDSSDLALNSFLKFFELNMPPHMKKNYTGKSFLEIKKKLRPLFQQQPGQVEKQQHLFYTRPKMPPAFMADENSSYMWLLKPTFLNRGRGIHIFNDLNTLEKLINDYCEGYVEKPLKKRDSNEDQQQPPSTSQDNTHQQQEGTAEANLFFGKERKDFKIRTVTNKTLDVVAKGEEAKDDTPSLQEQQQPNQDEETNQNANNQQQQEDQPNEGDQQQQQQQPQQGNEKEKEKEKKDNNVKSIQQKQQVQPPKTQIPQKKQTQETKVPNSAAQKHGQKTDRQDYSQKQQEKVENQDPNNYIHAMPQGQPILKAHNFVVQKYVERPFLIDKRKFDIRVWVMVTHEMDAYFFKEGYIRTSSEEFRIDPQSIENQFIHLTNNAIQKYSDNYGNFEFGNQRSFEQLQNILEPVVNFKEKTLPKIKDIIWMSLCSVKKKINPFDRKYCFEIFGYDFILDYEANPWIIEVNVNPCIEEASPLLAMLIPRMLDDGLKLTLDVLFPRIKPQNKTQVQQMQQAMTNTLELKRMQSNEKPMQNQQANQSSQQQQMSNTAREGFAGVNQQDQNDQIIKASFNNTIDNDKKVEELQNEVQINNETIEQNALFEKQNQEQIASKFHVTGFSDTENMWELLGSLKESNFNIKKKLQQKKI